jgi:hypothetical protein
VIKVAIDKDYRVVFSRKKKVANIPLNSKAGRSGIMIVLPLLLIIGLAFILLPIYLYIMRMGLLFPNRLEDLGSFGDYFAGTMNPLFSFLSFVGLLLTIGIQTLQLREIRLDLRQTRQLSEQQAKRQEHDAAKNDLITAIKAVDADLQSMMDNTLNFSGVPVSFHEMLSGQGQAGHTVAFPNSNSLIDRKDRRLIGDINLAIKELDRMLGNIECYLVDKTIYEYYLRKYAFCYRQLRAGGYLKPEDVMCAFGRSDTLIGGNTQKPREVKKKPRF